MTSKILACQARRERDELSPALGALPASALDPLRFSDSLEGSARVASASPGRLSPGLVYLTLNLGLWPRGGLTSTSHRVCSAFPVFLLFWPILAAPLESGHPRRTWPPCQGSEGLLLLVSDALEDWLLLPVS